MTSEPTPERYCACGCGEPILRRPNEPRGHFLRRRTTAKTACVDRVRRRVGITRQPAAVLDDWPPGMRFEDARPRDGGAFTTARPDRSDASMTSSATAWGMR